VAKLIYINSTKEATFSLYPVEEATTDTPDTTDNNIFLYPVSSVADANSVYDISGAT
jgi:hypothetical protein